VEDGGGHRAALVEAQLFGGGAEAEGVKSG